MGPPIFASFHFQRDALCWSELDCIMTHWQHSMAAHRAGTPPLPRDWEGNMVPVSFLSAADLLFHIKGFEMG